uniref:uncharacterized protein LOC131141456 n=1 Tax=Doryrhamphus excisus TaxID=161450 RepID=UPI0025AEA3C2|nr:uncharacterized protein LOC131141456 [Doryrhamphus excisus]XP_057947584.1 uncharacterized protein LOC131141456 [Doryrhamphus excisus]XP_057947585.1 uncharacterized protein LOC131141456 [Doryrhamphus excisus]
MLQYSTDSVNKTRQAHENICRANGPNNEAQGVLKKMSVLNGCVSGSSRTKPVETNFTKPPYVLNGCLKHGFEGKHNKAAPSRTHEKQKSTFLAACGPALAGGGIHGSSPRGILVNGGTRGRHAWTTSKPQATETGHPVKIRAKNQRRKRRHKKRDSSHQCPEEPTQELTPPVEEEDWESECQADWEKKFGVQPYGPEDVLHFALQDLSLEHWELGTVPNYSPAVHHSHPVQWTCPSTSTEPEQFADADE